jgi:tetratricopeptide (TPR) repeat protein
MDSSRPKINGIFSEETTITLGTGHTKKTQLVKNYCHAEEGQDDTVQVSYLGNDGHPTGIVITMPCEEFLNKYTFEPDFKVRTRQERDTDKHIAMAEKHRSRKEFNSAEWEYHTALKIDPDSIRANFGVGTLYMEMGQADKARDIFKKLSQIEAIFEEENKHIFNEFGIQLRKASMADEALANYLKAIEISPQDENLYFNVARLYYDSKDWENAMRWIEKSLSINEYFHEARQFEGVIRRALKEQGGGSLQDSGTGSPSADRPAEASPETPKG